MDYIGIMENKMGSTTTGYMGLWVMLVILVMLG